jgi:hypothetical protein
MTLFIGVTFFVFIYIYINAYKQTDVISDDAKIYSEFQNNFLH